MFNIDKRYMTIGIKENVGLDIQLFIWHEVDERINSKQNVDYLQVFNISIINESLCIVQIEHIQEIPEYKNTLIIKSNGIRENLKVYVILEHESGYATMLLSSEY